MAWPIFWLLGTVRSVAVRSSSAQRQRGSGSQHTQPRDAEASRAPSFASDMYRPSTWTTRIVKGK